MSPQALCHLRTVDDKFFPLHLNNIFGIHLTFSSFLNVYMMTFFLASLYRVIFCWPPPISVLTMENLCSQLELQVQGTRQIRMLLIEIDDCPNFPMWKILPTFKIVEISLRHYLIVVLRSLFRRQREKLILTKFRGWEGDNVIYLANRSNLFLENAFEGDKTWRVGAVDNWCQRFSLCCSLL